MPDLSKGIPRGRPSRKIPTSFQRPSISVKGPNHVSKLWRWAALSELAAGDVVRDKGVIRVTSEQFTENHEWLVELTFASDVSTVVLPGDVQVYAYTLPVQENK